MFYGEVWDFLSEKEACGSSDIRLKSAILFFIPSGKKESAYESYKSTGVTFHHFVLGSTFLFF